MKRILYAPLAVLAILVVATISNPATLLYEYEMYAGNLTGDTPAADSVFLLAKGAGKDTSAWFQIIKPREKQGVFETQTPLVVGDSIVFTARAKSNGDSLKFTWYLQTSEDKTYASGDSLPLTAFASLAYNAGYHWYNLLTIIPFQNIRTIADTGGVAHSTVESGTFSRNTPLARYARFIGLSNSGTDSVNIGKVIVRGWATKQ